MNLTYSISLKGCSRYDKLPHKSLGTLFKFKDLNYKYGEDS